MLEHPGKRLFNFDGLRPAIRCRAGAALLLDRDSECRSSGNQT